MCIVKFFLRSVEDGPKQETTSTKFIFESFMITFYPRKDVLWEDDFKWDNPITLTPKEKYDYKYFRNRREFVEFIRPRLPSLEVRLEFVGPRYFEERKTYGYTVKCSTVIGWFTDDYR